MPPPPPSPPATTTSADIPAATPPEDLPLALTASVVLTSLPPSERRALDSASHPPPRKVMVRYQAIGSAPVLNKKTYPIKSNLRYENVVVHLRRVLGLREEEGLWTYVNAAFMPAGDEGVGNLWDCFKVDDCLIVSYSMTPAFG